MNPIFKSILEYHLFGYHILQESIYSDVVKKYPQIKDKLEIAQKSLGDKLTSKYINWIAKQLSISSEPVEDILPLLKSFEKNQDKIKKIFQGNSGDINSYKTVGDLSNRLEELNKSTENKQGVAGEIIYSSKDSPWVVTMPHNTEESCDAGSGTTWCTARTQSQNLFLSYVGRDDDIILFYVINKNENPRKNPNAKLSVGFVHGKPVFNQGHGGLTVNANNDGLTEENFSEIVGPENAKLFLRLMAKKAEELKGKHPAQAEIELIRKDFYKAIKKLESFKNKEERDDFFGLLFWSTGDYDMQNGIRLANKLIPPGYKFNDIGLLVDLFLGFSFNLTKGNLISNTYRFFYSNKEDLEYLKKIYRFINENYDVVSDFDTDWLAMAPSKEEFIFCLTNVPLSGKEFISPNIFMGSINANSFMPEKDKKELEDMFDEMNNWPSFLSSNPDFSTLKEYFYNSIEKYKNDKLLLEKFVEEFMTHLKNRKFTKQYSPEIMEILDNPVINKKVFNFFVAGSKNFLGYKNYLNYLLKNSKISQHSAAGIYQFMFYWSTYQLGKYPEDSDITHEEASKYAQLFLIKSKELNALEMAKQPPEKPAIVAF